MQNKFIAPFIITLLAVTAIGLGLGIVYAEREPDNNSSDTTAIRLEGTDTISINPEEIDPDYVAEPDIEIPTLTGDEEKMAIDIALSDPRVQELLFGKKYEICAIGVVHTTELVKTGAGILLCLDKAYEIEYDWPYTVYNEEFDTIEDQVYHEELSVQTLSITVDFQQERVEVISPLCHNVDK